MWTLTIDNSTQCTLPQCAHGFAYDFNIKNNATYFPFFFKLLSIYVCKIITPLSLNFKWGKP